MRVVAVECNCKEPYADGALPSFYTDERKAVFMWSKLKEKCKRGADRAHSELVVDPNPPWEVISRREPLPNLKDYNLYFGVHLNGLHILTVKP